MAEVNYLAISSRAPGPHRAPSLSVFEAQGPADIDLILRLFARAPSAAPGRG